MLFLMDHVMPILVNIPAWQEKCWQPIQYSIEYIHLKINLGDPAGCASLFRGIVSLIKGPTEFEFSPGIILGILWLDWFFR
jgi:hypothetical protein